MSLFLFSSFLGMHRNISLSCWWKWPCSNDGNGPLLAASVQCIISLNEFAPVPAHQPSPAPSKGQAVQPLPNWKKIEGGFGWLWGSWDLSRLDIWSNASGLLLDQTPLRRIFFFKFSSKKTPCCTFTPFHQKFDNFPTLFYISFACSTFHPIFPQHWILVNGCPIKAIKYETNFSSLRSFKHIWWIQYSVFSSGWQKPCL